MPPKVRLAAVVVALVIVSVLGLASEFENVRMPTPVVPPTVRLAFTADGEPML